MNPLVTIITATYNAEYSLIETIKSIRGQIYQNIEWIVIDGNSSDNTVNIIKQNQDIIRFWVSEPDTGIYNAWNKGVSKANGEWIAFLGAGDTLYPNAISDYISAINLSCISPQLISSRIRLIDKSGNCKRIIGQRYDWGKFKNRMNIAHVGALHNIRLFKKYGLFDCTYSVAADYEFFFRAGPNLNAEFIETITADMILGGASNGYKVLEETYQIHKKYSSNFNAIILFVIAIIKKFVRPFTWGYK